MRSTRSKRSSSKKKEENQGKSESSKKTEESQVKSESSKKTEESQVKSESSKKTEESQAKSESSKKTDESQVKKSKKVSLSLKNIRNIIKKKEERAAPEQSTSRGPIKITIPLHDCVNHTSNKGHIQEIKHKPEKTNKKKEKKLQNDKDTNKRNKQTTKKNKTEEEPKTSQEHAHKNPKLQKVDEEVEITFPKESTHVPMKEPHNSVTIIELLRGMRRDLKMIKVNHVIQSEQLNKEIGNILNEKNEKLYEMLVKISTNIDKKDDNLNKIMTKHLQPVIKLLDNINQKLESHDCKTHEATSNNKEGTTSSDDVIRQAEMFSQQNKAELLKIAEQNAAPKQGTKRKGPDAEENLQIRPAKLRERRSTFHHTAPTPNDAVPITQQSILSTEEPRVVTQLPVAVPAHQGQVTRQTVAATQQPLVAARHPVPLQPPQLDALFQVNKVQPIIARRRSLAAPSYYATRDALYLDEMLKMGSVVDPRLQNMRSIPNLFSQHATTQNAGINLTRDDTNAIHPTVQNDVISPQSYAVNARPRENSSVNQENPGLYSTRPTVRYTQPNSGNPVQARGSNLFNQHATTQNAGINQTRDAMNYLQPGPQNNVVSPHNYTMHSRPREHSPINQSPGLYANASAQPTQINSGKHIMDFSSARPTARQNTCSYEIQERTRFYGRVGRASQHNPSNQESYGANSSARLASPRNQHNYGTHLNPSYVNFNTRQIQDTHPGQQNPQNYGYFSRLAEADNSIKNQTYLTRSAGAAHASGRAENK